MTEPFEVQTWMESQGTVGYGAAPHLLNANDEITDTHSPVVLCRTRLHDGLYIDLRQPTASDYVEWPHEKKSDKGKKWMKGGTTRGTASCAGRMHGERASVSLGGA